jgi:hypothetical protein
MPSTYASTARTRQGQAKKNRGQGRPRILPPETRISGHAEHHRLVVDIELAFGMAVRGELKCAPLNADDCRACSRAARCRWRDCRASAGRKELVMIDPSPELPDDMPIASVELPPKVQQALIAAGLRTVGKIRETSDTEILRIQDLGQSSLNFLRVHSWPAILHGGPQDAIPMTAKPENRDH